MNFNFNPLRLTRSERNSGSSGRSPAEAYHVLHTQEQQSLLERATLVSRMEVLEAQLQAQQDENKRLHSLLQRLQANLEHYQATSGRKIEAQKLSLEQERLTCLKAQQTSEKYRLLNEYNDNALRQHHIEKKALEERYIALEKSYQAQTLRCYTLSTENTRLQAIFEELKEQAKARVTLYHKLEAEFALLTEQYKDLQQSAQQTEETLQLLRTGKLALNREDTNLIG